MWRTKRGWQARPRSGLPSLLLLGGFHGRWYNPVNALWLSRDEKGEYVYGSGQDAVNWYLAQLRASAQWDLQQFQALGNASVGPIVAFGKSSPEAKAVVLGAGQFVADTAMASHYAMLPPRNWTLEDRVRNATRATVPVVMAEGMVAFGPPALEATGSCLYRSLLARVGQGVATGCALEGEECGEAVSGVVRLYRVVSPDELRDIMSNGFRQHPGGFSYEAKLFTTSVENAEQFGQLLYPSKPFSIVEVTIPQSFAGQLWQGILDRMPSVAVYENQLQELNTFLSTLRVIR